ncbi:glucose 1-dehydrogenase [Candidatus Bathyarchaeota archaeon]|nr:glucose 1-dehydrogenase [Candidatus Bathyarchaeota archaeon]
MMRLRNKVVLITGAGRGIGRSIAKLFAQEGAKVVINYSKSESEAASLAKEIEETGGETLLVKADVSKSDQVKEMVKRVIDRFGRIDILVNNAGVLFPAGFLDSTEEMWNRTIDVNLKGAYLCSKEVAPIMLSQRKGKIINIASVCGLAQHSALGNTPYAVSKAGVIGLTRSLAVNLGPYINVNAIAPGVIDTEMVSFFTPERKRMIIEETLLKRVGRPEEVAKVALFLASEESDFITGEVITVSGGRGMR